MNTKKINNIKEVFDYRFFIMGIAMLWIMIFHAGLDFEFVFLKFIKSTGYGGVDIFLFCSGYGCFCSLEKNSNIISFIKKRFLKIFPTWIMFLCVWFTYKAVVGEISLGIVIGNVFCIQSFTTLGNSFNWYICALWVFYFISPYLFSLCTKFNLKMNILVLGLLVLFMIPFMGDTGDLIISVSRAPIFYLGMIAGKYKKKEISKKFKITMIFISFLGLISLVLFMQFLKPFLWSHALYWLPFILITPGLLMCIAMCAKVLNRISVTKYISKLIYKIGECSFEIYLIHIFLFNAITSLVSKGLLTNSNLMWLAGILIVFPIAFIFRVIVKNIYGFVLNKMIKVIPHT